MHACYTEVHMNNAFLSTKRLVPVVLISVCNVSISIHRFFLFSLRSYVYLNNIHREKNW